MAFGDSTVDGALHDGWVSFCETLQRAGDFAFKEANGTSGAQRADAFRFLTQNLGQAFDLALETRDPRYPQIHPFCTPTRKLGGDVADFTYRQAWIDGAHTYRVTGKRGTAKWLNITVQGPRPATIPGTDSPSLHEPFGDIPETNVFGHQLVTDADGAFELIVGGAPRPTNWLPTTPSSRKLFIREAFDDWSETATALTIERLGMEEPRPVPSVEQMIEAFGWAGDFVTGVMRDWPEHSWSHSGGLCDPAFRNQFPPDKAAATDADSKRGRIAAHMVWRLAPDETLVVEMDQHEGFWIFGMGGAFVGSMDFLYRPVSYTPARTAVDSDGVVRLVLAHDDPGVRNWLDTQGFSDGNLTYRNLVTPGCAPTSTTFRTTVVPRADLLSVLPSDTALVNAAERSDQLRRRYRAVKARYGI